MAPMSLGKLEKILGHIKANDQVVAGKISLADFTILQAYIMMCDAKMNSLEAFKTACPTGRVLTLDNTLNSKQIFVFKIKILFEYIFKSVA